MMGNQAIFHTDALAAGYAGEAVLRDINFNLRPGEILTLIGPNGAGKSTLLKTIIRQLEPVGGMVYFGEKPMDTMRENETARFLSIVMTARIDGEWMTAEDVVGTGRYPYTGRLGILSAADREKVEEAMALTHVTELRERYYPQLSDGQRQRVLLARAVCQEPKVLVMDEPTSFLDIRYQLELASLLRGLAERRNLAVILSLHELELARRISDTVLCLRGGRVDRAGTAEEVLTDEYIEELYELPAGSYRTYYGRSADGSSADSQTAKRKPQTDSQTAKGRPQTNSQTATRKPQTDSETAEAEAQAGDGPHYAFFQNCACEAFPCHEGVPAAAFNCLFCYCPLYALGPRCGGHFTYTGKGRKDCTRCAFPHVRGNYQAVLSRYPEVAELAKNTGAD